MTLEHDCVIQWFPCIICIHPRVNVIISKFNLFRYYFCNFFRSINIRSPTVQPTRHKVTYWPCILNDVDSAKNMDGQTQELTKLRIYRSLIQSCFVCSRLGQYVMRTASVWKLSTRNFHDSRWHDRIHDVEAATCTRLSSLLIVRRRKAFFGHVCSQAPMSDRHVTQSTS